MQNIETQTAEEAVRSHFSKNDQTAIFAQIPAKIWYGNEHEGDKEDTLSIFEQEEHRYDTNSTLIYIIEDILKYGYDEYDWIADEENATEVNYYIRRNGDYCNRRMSVNYLQQQL